MSDYDLLDRLDNIQSMLLNFRYFQFAEAIQEARAEIMSLRNSKAIIEANHILRDDDCHDDVRVTDDPKSVEWRIQIVRKLAGVDEALRKAGGLVEEARWVRIARSYIRWVAYPHELWAEIRAKSKPKSQADLIWDKLPEWQKNLLVKDYSD